MEFESFVKGKMGGLEFFFELGSGLERDSAGSRDVDSFASAWVASLASGTFFDSECSKAWEGEAALFEKSIFDSFEGLLNHLFCKLLGEFVVVSVRNNLIDQFGFSHGSGLLTMMDCIHIHHDSVKSPFTGWKDGVFC